jgi:hypothetical protein
MEDAFCAATHYDGDFRVGMVTADGAGGGGQEEGVANVFGFDQENVHKAQAVRPWRAAMVAK